MKASDIVKEDLEFCMQLQGILAEAQLTIAPSKCGDIHVCMEWFKRLGVAIGKGYQEERAKPKTPESQTPSPDKPAAEMGGMKILDYHPGDLSGPAPVVPDPQVIKGKAGKK